MNQTTLDLRAALPVVARDGGLFISRGVGRHPERVWGSFDLIYVRSGVLGIQEESISFTVSAGQTLLLWPGRRHWGTAPYAPDLSFYWIHFVLPEGGTDAANPLLLSVPQYATLARPDHMTTLCRRFLDDQEIGALDPASASLLILLMLQEMTRLPMPGEGLEKSSAILAQRANAYIMTHYHEQIGVSTMARELGCNPNYLSRVYRQTYNRTPTEAIHRNRLQNAQRRLLDSLSNIDEIARESGFDDPGYFRRLFKRELGMTPLAYRRLYARVKVISE